MFLVRQFMDNAIVETYPLPQASERLTEATYDQLHSCLTYIYDAAQQGKFIGWSDTAKAHVSKIHELINAEIFSRVDVIVKWGDSEEGDVDDR